MGSFFDLPDDVKLYYENGQLERNEFCKNGVRKEGKYWFENGQLQEHSFYNGRQREGPSKSWYINGVIWLNIFYRKNKLEGKYECRYANSKMKLRTFCRGGKIEGESKLYESNGSLKEHFYWINNKMIDANFTSKRNILARLNRNLYSRTHSLNSFLISDLSKIIHKFS